MPLHVAPFPTAGPRARRASSHKHYLWGRTIIELWSRFYDSNPRQHRMARNYTVTEYVLYLQKRRKFHFPANCRGPVIGRDQSFAGKLHYYFSKTAGKAALGNLNAVLVICFLSFLFSPVIKCNKKKEFCIAMTRKRCGGNT